MGTTQKSLINYENPPVVEVVCGILFESIRNFLAPHIGLLWEKFRPEYPECREAPPLTPTIETFEREPSSRKLEFEISETPPLPRIWFVHENENGLIQVQRNRFLHNWRKIRPSDEYPRYYYVIEMFRKQLSQFKSFLQENNLGEISPLQYEMTYINHIPQGDGWDSIKDIGKLFPDFVFRRKRGRFLNEPEAINWRTSFILPNQAGRFHVTIQKIIESETNRPILVLNSTVRGIGSDKSTEGMWEWFDLAHKWIVYGFADLTAKEVQKTIWGLKE